MPERFEEWWQDMRRRAWKEVRAGYDGEPMYEGYLVLLRPYFLEAYNHIPAERASECVVVNDAHVPYSDDPTVCMVCGASLSAGNQHA